MNIFKMNNVFFPLCNLKYPGKKNKKSNVLQSTEEKE